MTVTHLCSPPLGNLLEWTCSCGLTWLHLGPVWVDVRVKIIEPTSQQRAPTTVPDGQRTEADDEWLVTHSTNTLKALAGHLPGLQRLMVAGTALDAVMAGSGLGIGTFKPPPQGAEASVVRYAEGRYAYTRISVSSQGLCAICGFDSIHTHRLQLIHQTGTVTEVGSLTVCANCEPDSFLFTSYMPSVVASRHRRAGSVL